jgi:adenine-specific DNA-methyltransferase
MITESLHALDHIRESFNTETSRTERSLIGQFLTPAAIAHFMSSMFDPAKGDARILDPGAGAGVLFAACIEKLISQKIRPRSIEVVAYETDLLILPHLEKTIKRCEALCKAIDVPFRGTIKVEDFLLSAITETSETLFAAPLKPFTHVIMNPPYKKINVRTEIAKRLYASGIEVANLYAAFVWLSIRMLEQGGQIVAITPRSFCNGPYFKKFRLTFLRIMNIKRIHIFMSRDKAFGDDNVLQENIIYHAVKGEHKTKPITISMSEGVDFDNELILSIPYGEVVHPGDRDGFIHLGVDKDNLDTLEKMGCFVSSFARLKLEVSTGRVVDFRAKEFLRQRPQDGTAPLIYPCHFSDGFINWPVETGKKPNAIVSSSETSDLLVDAGYYVLTKRFSSKEQKRRVMAAIYDPSRINAPRIGFENHLNYFHRQGRGLPAGLAKGLALYLNSTIVDRYFRLFSGHTQVNATDLRKMPYPTHEQLLRFGSYVKDKIPDQETIDAIVEKECLFSKTPDPLQ